MNIQELCKDCFVMVISEAQAHCSMCSAVGCDFKTCTYTENEIDNSAPACEDFNCKADRYCMRAYELGCITCSKAAIDSAAEMAGEKIAFPE